MKNLFKSIVHRASCIVHQSKTLTLLLVMLMSVNVWGADLSVGDALFTEAFKGGTNSTTFSAATYSSTYSSITWFEGNSKDGESISFESGNAMPNTGSATNMTSSHMWLNKSTSGYVQINDIPLHNVTGFQAHWSQAGAKQVSFSYKFNGESSWTSGGSNSNAGSDVKANEISVAAGKTSVSIKLVRSNNTTNVRVDNISLVATAVASAATDPYTVTFDGNDHGTPAKASEKEASAGAGITLPDCEANTGYKFLGWSKSNTAISADSDLGLDKIGKTYYPSKDETLYAVYVEVYTISWSANGTSLDPTYVEKGQTLVLPEDPDPETYCAGKTFMGWTSASSVSSDGKGITYAQNGDAVSASTPYYAVFADASEGAGASGSYTLNYDPDVKDKSLGYGSAVNVTAEDGSAWIVKAYKNGGMQINTGKNSCIKIPNCPSNITSIAIECSTAKAVGFSAADYSGSGDISYIVTGTTAKSQTLDFTGKEVTAGYIVPKEGSTAITKVVVNYGTGTTYSNYTTTCSGDPVIEGLTITPSAEPTDGKYWEPITATISCTTEGVAIKYSLDGSEPSIDYTAGAEIAITATSTLKVKATKSGYQDASKSQTFTFGKVYADVAAFLSDAKNIAAEEKIKITDVKVVISSFSNNKTTVYFEDASFYTDGTVHPSTYAVGRVLKGSDIMFTFKDYDPYQIRPTSWDVFTCVSPLPNVEGLAEDKTATSVKLTWTAVTNAGSYVVKFDGVEQTATTNTYLEISGLEVKSTHSWYVKALTADEDVALDGDYGATARQFTTLDVPHTVTFNAGEKGTCETASLIEGSVGEGVTLPDVTVTATGYEFKGWSTSETPTSADAGVAGATYKPAKDITLYAYYTPQVYEISYKDQNNADFSGSNADALVKSHTYNQATTLVAGEKYGYRFEGWFGNAECDGDPMTSVAANTYSQDFTLYAKWTRIMPTSIVLSETEVTIPWNADKEADNKIKITATVYPEGVAQEVQWSAGDYNDFATVKSGWITGRADGDAIITCTSTVDKKLSAQVIVHVTHVPALTWLNADGTTFATTKATALNGGKVVLPVVDAEHQPVTCDAEYSHFYGWSENAFNAQDAAPELVTAETDAPKDQTFYAVFAKGEGGTAEYVEVSSVTEGTYVLVSKCGSNTNYQYMPNTESASSNPALGNGITMKTEGGKTTLTNTITDAMLWDLNTSNEESEFYIQPHGDETSGLGTNSSTGDKIRIGADYIDSWKITKNDSHGWDFYNGYYLAVYSTTAWRNYGNNTTNQNGTFYLFQQQGGIEYTSYLSSCCEGLDITLTNGGTKDHGTFAAVAKECATKPVTLTASPEYGYSLSTWTVKETSSQNPVTVTRDETDANKATFTMPEAAVTVDAEFVANKHTMTFNKMSGSPLKETQEFTFGVEQNLKANTFTRDGYKFMGWSTTGYSGEVAYADGAAYTLTTDDDVDLYAIWAADDAQLVTIHTEHMTITNEPKEVSKTAESLSFAYTMDEGYKVTAVAVTVGTKTLTNNEIVFDQEHITITPAANQFKNGAVVITFTVEEILYTVTLNPGSGACEKTEVKQTAFGAAVTLPAATTIADGWTFAGWAAAAVPEETKDAPAALYTGEYTPAEDLTLFAVYEHCEEVEDATKKYIYDFDDNTSTTDWSLTNLYACNKITAHSGSKHGSNMNSSGTGQKYAYLSTKAALTGTYKVTAYVTRTSNNTNSNGTFSIQTKVGSGSWSIKDNTSITANSITPEKWYELSWKGQLNNEYVEIAYNADGTAFRAIDDVTIVAISEDCKYHSTPSVVTALKVATAPAANIKYKEGETFNPAGIVLTATYDNDKTKTETVISEMFTCDFSGAVPYGETTVTFTYKGKTCTQTIIGRRLQEISIKTAPEELTLTYVEGETFSNKNLSVNALFAFNEDTKTEGVKKENLTYNPSLETPLKTTDTKVTISYTWAGVTKSVDQEITVVGKVATPTFSPAGGKLAEETPIVISCATQNATIYYTTDGTDPTTESDVYTQPVPMISGTLKAIATAENMGQSEVGKAVFIETIDPTNGDWMLVTDVNDLAEGDYLIIASKEKGWVAGKTEGQNLEHITTTFSADKSSLTYTADAMMFRLGGETDAWTLTNVDKEHLMGATAEKKLSWNAGTTTWSITIDNSNNATIQNGSDYGRMLDNTANYFTTYKSATSGTMLLPQLYKYYKAVPKLIYDANGGENAPVPTRSENGKAIVTDQQPTRGGYEFVNWTSDKEGEDDVYAKGDEVTLTADMTIYAQWQEKQLEGTPVVFVVKYNENYYAMGKDLSAVEVLGIINGKVAVTKDFDKKSITWYRNDVEGGVTLQNCEEKYLVDGNKTALTVEETPATWIWNSNGYYATESNSDRTFFLQGTEAFKNYAVSNIGKEGFSSAATCYTEFLIGSEVITRATAPGKIGTICMKKDIVATEGGVIYMPDYKDANAKNVYFIEATEELAIPGMPFIFVGEADNMRVLLGYEETIAPVSDLDQTRGMVGTFTEITAPTYQDADGSRSYFFSENKLWKVGDVTVPANRAYLLMDGVPSQDNAIEESASAPRRHLSLMNANATDMPTGFNYIFGNPAEAIQKLIINNQLIIIRHGHFYNAAGAKMK